MSERESVRERERERERETETDPNSRTFSTQNCARATLSNKLPSP